MTNSLLTLELRGSDVWRRCGDVSRALPGDPDPAARLEGWAKRYRQAVTSRSDALLLEIGREMFAWLDTGGGLAGWVAGGERVLELVVTEPGDLGDALLGAPWEILADDTGFLAADRLKRFVPVRRIAAAADPQIPAHSDLSMLFMAAAPEGQKELDYEAEEAAILEATRSRSSGAPLVHVTVEESGELDVLADRIANEARFEILHLSCHGTIERKDDETRPVLILETAEGGEDTVAPDRLVGALGQSKPGLLFLSACRTGERGAAGMTMGGPHKDRLDDGSVPFAPGERREDTSAAPTLQPGLAEPLARRMALHVPHVLGWDGSVYDADASAFAQGLYAGLGRGQSVAYAAAGARHDVMDAAAQGAPGKHWHLARVYLGPGGGGTLCDKGKPHRPAQAQAEQSFLDTKGQVKVANRAEFVGRRRELQRLRRAFAGTATGALVFGLGNLGKSSMAARLADRMTGHRLSVVYGAYHGLAIMEELARVAKLIANNLSFTEKTALLAELDAMTQAVTASEDALFDALTSLLSSVFQQHPILLIIDDLEQALEDPAEGQRLTLPKSGNRAALGGVLQAFAAAPTRSRLLLTSRYDFTLPDPTGTDLAAPLVRVPLMPMRPRERRKQWRAKSRAEAKEAQLGVVPEALVAKALQAAAGNPGLQEVLTRPLLAGEAETAQEAIAAVRHYRETGAHPAEGNAALEFFTRVSFETYEKALSETETLALAAAAVFEEEVPIPRAAIAAAAGALGVADPAPALDRLLALGLLDDWGAMGWAGMEKLPHHAANPLARPLAPALPDDIAATAAEAALPALAQAWRDTEGDFPQDARGVAACRLALKAQDPAPEILEAAALATLIHLYAKQSLAPAALTLAVPALERLEATGHSPSGHLIYQLTSAADQAGDVELQNHLLAMGAALDRLGDSERAALIGQRVDRMLVTGKLEEAEKLCRESLIPIYEALGNTSQLAAAWGRIADVLKTKGKYKEAIQIHEEKEIPTFRANGDEHSLAVLSGQIADIRVRQGHHRQALRVRQEQEIPVYEKLGDRRSLAIARGKVADSLEALGERKEALGIRQELLEEFVAMGDRSNLAGTKAFIADNLSALGNVDDAISMYRDEALPEFESLGDNRSYGITLGKLADALEASGRVDEAIRIRREKQLPIFEELDDKREIAVTRGKIANGLEEKGEFDEALEIHLSRLVDAQTREDLDSLVHIRISCARLRLARGDHERGDWQTIYDELNEAFAGAQKLGIPNYLAESGWYLGQIFAATGNRELAIEVLKTAARAYDKLGWAEETRNCRRLIADLDSG